MTDLELSTFHGDFEDIEAINRILDEFAQAHHVQPHLKRMHWATSWSDLVNVASFGQGPDISHIGETWVSSLIGLNALRPFKPHEFESLGGEGVFTPTALDGAKIVGNQAQWSIPWTSFAFLLCYRKDSLNAYGIDPESAFASLPAMQTALDQLKENSRFDSPWLMPFAPQPYPDLLHIAASWVWGAGGDFVDASNPRHPTIVFNQPAALEGLRGWLEAYRNIPQHFQQVNARDCGELFIRGRSPLIVTSVRTAARMLNSDIPAEIRENVAFAPISAAPWCGGDGLIIWKHVQAQPEHEQLALRLVEHFTSAYGMTEFCRTANAMPARRDALEQVFPPETPLHRAVSKISQQGRNYPTIPQWRTIEHQLAQELDNILFEARTRTSIATTDIIRAHIVPLAERLARTLPA